VNKLEQALADIETMQAHLARARFATCYRWASVSITSALAILGSVLQNIWGASNSAMAFVLFWSAIAALSVATVACEIAIRSVRESSRRQRSVTWETIVEFLPCLAIACGVTGVVLRNAVQHSPMLPGLWGCFFSLGILASRSRLPSTAVYAAGYYFVGGLVCVAVGSTEGWSFSPWLMGGLFGGGQALTAWLLWQDRRRNHAQS
jgi:hypothetical protein